MARPAHSSETTICACDCGNKPLELKKGKPTIELAGENELLPTLRELREAIKEGEFDTVLMAAKKERAKRFVRGSA